jgi:hypothetical protein
MKQLLDETDVPAPPEPRKIKSMKELMDEADNH